VFALHKDLALLCDRELIFIPHCSSSQPVLCLQDTHTQTHTHTHTDTHTHRETQMRGRGKGRERDFLCAAVLPVCLC
jgi:hypothetical protein